MWLGDIHAGRASSGGLVDDGFLENVCTGTGPPSSAERMVAFLRDIYVEHPLDDVEIMTASRWVPAGASVSTLQSS
jgi:hypothetical protein